MSRKKELVNRVVISNKIVEALRFLDHTQLDLVLKQAGKLAKQRKKQEVPVSIFTNKLTVLESLVKFFVEVKGEPLCKVGLRLNRSEKQLWHTYNNAKKKFSGALPIKSSVYVPESVFTDRRVSPTEGLVVFLREIAKMKFSEISFLLNRNEKTVWTSYSRAKKKYEKT
jgi:hypothetical protein